MATTSSGSNNLCSDMQSLSSDSGFDGHQLKEQIDKSLEDMKMLQGLDNVVMFKSRFGFVGKSKGRTVCTGVDLATNQMVIGKLRSPLPTSIRGIKYEASIYSKLAKYLQDHPEYFMAFRKFNIAIPTVIATCFNKVGEERTFLIVSDAGKDLETHHVQLHDPLTQEKCGFGIKKLCSIAIQGLALLRFLHDTGFIHRDVHPGNFALDLETGTLSIFDFQATDKYLIEKLKHVPNEAQEHRNGSTRSYCTAKAEKRRLSQLLKHGNIVLKTFIPRKDDLEMLALMLIDLAKPQLPWKKSQSCWSLADSTLKINKMKKWRVEKEVKGITKGLPKIFKKFLEHTREMEFEQTPDYSSWMKLFKKEKLKQS